MKVKLLFAPAALLLASASPSNPQSSADLRCLYVALELSGSDDPAMSNSGLMSTLYFLGKIDGRSPGSDLESMIRSEATRITEQERRALLVRCGTELKQRGEYLQAMGKRLEQPSAS